MSIPYIPDVVQGEGVTRDGVGFTFVYDTTSFSDDLPISRDCNGEWVDVQLDGREVGLWVMFNIPFVFQYEGAKLDAVRSFYINKRTLASMPKELREAYREGGA